jgi:serine protease Do
MTQQRTYMKMGTGGVGLALGLGGFQTQIVILFETPADFDTFVYDGYDATAQTGALVGDVLPNSPAAQAGLRGGDVVVALDGQPVPDSRSLARVVGAARPGAAVTLTVRRGAETKQLQATLARLEERAEGGPGNGKPGAPARQQSGRLGLALAPLDEAARHELQLPDGTEGAVVASIRPGSLAAEAGLRPGDVIIAVGNTTVRDAASAAEALRGVSGPAALRVLRGGSALYIAVG